jgi:hypothetical protein
MRQFVFLILFLYISTIPRLAFLFSEGAGDFVFQMDLKYLTHRSSVMEREKKKHTVQRKFVAVTQNSIRLQ